MFAAADIVFGFVVAAVAAAAAAAAAADTVFGFVAVAALVAAADIVFGFVAVAALVAAADTVFGFVAAAVFAAAGIVLDSVAAAAMAAADIVFGSVAADVGFAVKNDIEYLPMMRKIVAVFVAFAAIEVVDVVTRGLIVTSKFVAVAVSDPPCMILFAPEELEQLVVAVAEVADSVAAAAVKLAGDTEALYCQC